VAETHAGPAPERHTKGDQALGEPQRAPGPGSGHRGQPFGEDAALAVAIAAEPLADTQLEAYAILRPGQISQGAFVVAVDTPRRESAERTGHAGLHRAHAQGDLCRGVIDGTRLEAQRGGIG
jgi:hypothetical protein